MIQARTIQVRSAVAGACLLVTTWLAVYSCTSLQAGSIDTAYPFPDTEKYQPKPISETQTLIVNGGRSLVGKQTLVVNGVVYPNDCTGLVRAAYAFASIDLAYRFNRYDGNGVSRIYETLRDQGQLYAVRFPAPADLLFWDGTWDANGNGKADDELTHVGVVLSVEADGSIQYLHFHYRLGPTIERMNLIKPDDVSIEADGPVNAIVRMRGAPGISMGNAAQLFRVFGKGYRLPPP